MKHIILLEARIKPVNPEILRKKIYEILKNNNYDIEKISVERLDTNENIWHMSRLTIPFDKMVPYICISFVGGHGAKLRSDEKTKSKLIEMGKKLGWEPKEDEEDLCFAANYTPKVKIDRNKPLYHVTNEDNAKKILRNGLKPKPMSRYATPRIYVFDDLDDAKEYMKSLKDRILQGASSFSDLGKYKPVKPYIYILEIDPSKFGANYYADLEAFPPHIEHKRISAFWTYTHIPANAIKIHSKHFMTLSIFVYGISKKDKLNVFRKAFSKIRYKNKNCQKVEFGKHEFHKDYKDYIYDKFYLIDPSTQKDCYVDEREQKSIINKINHVVEKIKNKFSVIIITSNPNIVGPYDIIKEIERYPKGSVIWDPTLKNLLQLA